MSSYYSLAQVRRALARFFAGKAIGAAIGVATLLLVVRALSVEDYAKYVALVGYLEIFITVSSFGVVEAGERLIPQARAGGDGALLRRLVVRLVWARLGTLLMTSAIIAAAVYHVAPRFGHGDYVLPLILFQITVAAESAARFVESIFESLLMQGRAQISLMLRTGARLAVLVWVLQESSSIQLQRWLAYECAAYMIGAAGTMFLLWKAVAALSKASGPTGLRAVAAPSLHIFGSRVLGAVTSIDMVKLLVLKSTSVDFAAMFGFCATLAWMLQRYLPSHLLIGLVRPLIVAAVVEGENGKRKLARIVSVLVKLNGLVVGAMVVLFSASGDWLIMQLTGGKVNEGGVLMTLLLVFVLSNSVKSVYGHVGLAIGLGGRLLLAQSVAACVLVASAPAAFAIGGMVFPVALILMNVSWCGVVLSGLSHRSQLPEFRIRGAVVLIAMGAAAVTLGLIANLLAGFSTGSPLSVAIGLSATLAFLVALALLQPFEHDERAAINGLLPKPLFIF